MSRAQKRTKAEKRERRQRGEHADGSGPAMATAQERMRPLMPIVADFGSAALTADRPRRSV